MRVQHIDLFLEYIVNRHHEVRAKRLRTREPVAKVKEDGITLERRRIRHQIRHDHHVGGVLH